MPTIVSGLFRFKGQVHCARSALTIDASEIKFFKDALRLGCAFFKLDLASGTPVDLWQLNFFCDTRFACTMLVISRPLRANEALDSVTKTLFSEAAQALDISPSAGMLLDSGRLIYQQMPMDAAAVSAASKFMRGTNSLLSNAFEEKSGRYLAVEPRGLALISEAAGVAVIFQRYTVLLALLRAYQYAIDSAVDLLAELVAMPPSRALNLSLSALHRDSLVFAARFLFARPVRLDTVDLRYVWARLSDVNHLGEVHQELTEQLAAVHALLKVDEEKHEAVREKRGQYALTLIGLMLALISLLSLVDITPEKLHAFWHAWFGNSN